MDEFNFSLTQKISYLDQLIKLVNGSCLNGLGKVNFLDRIHTVCDSIEEELGLAEAPQGSEK